MLRETCGLVLSIGLLAACGGGSAPGAGTLADASSPSAPSAGDASTKAADDAGADDGGAADASGAGGASATLGFVDGSQYILYASIGGGPAHRVQLDTGSIGLYVPKSILGADAMISTTATCSITYVSSGSTLSGHEATARVALLGATTAGDVSPTPTTVPMSLCAVDDASFGGGMMGVGFGRAPKADPTRNVLLQMADAVSGAMHAGYVLSTHPTPHVQIGLTAAGTAGFQTIPLTADPSGSGDWVATSLRGCLAIPSAPSFGQPCGGLLVDTGVADCLLWGPPDPTLGGVVPSGQTTVPGGVSVGITAAAGGAILDYAFVVGQGADPPAAVSIRTAAAFSINTGRALLVDYDYSFDAKNGQVGFRRATP